MKEKKLLFSPEGRSRSGGGRFWFFLPPAWRLSHFAASCRKISGKGTAMERIPISAQGYARVKAELKRLKNERPAIIEAIREAREEGDLSENAGYDAARERQSLLEARIAYIESRMPWYNVVDLTSMNGDKAIFGATVRLADLDTGEERLYTLLGPDETDFAPRTRGAISVYSPVGRALLGKEVGDEISVDAPRGKIQYEIIEIRFQGPAIDP
jgi:transcription elongation factor GreA